MAQSYPDFDPGDVGQPGSLFGFPYSIERANLVVIPVPVDVTTSYRAGASRGPDAVLQASPQLDFMIPDIAEPWTFRTVMDEIPCKILEENTRLRDKVEPYLRHLETGAMVSDFSPLLNDVNRFTEEVLRQVRQNAERYLDQGKKVAVLGGDHSSPLGLVQALAKKYEDFGVLHMDAHMDLRQAYEGFEHSHASIMHHVLDLESVQQITMLAVRDYSPAEAERVDQEGVRIKVFYDAHLKAGHFDGIPWKKQCNQILETLPANVYISLDVDALTPAHCPHTGTPVPGGLEFAQLHYLLDQLIRSGREIIGFDLCEVNPGANGEDHSIDAMVGARLLYLLCSYTGLSEGKLSYTTPDSAI